MDQVYVLALCAFFPYLFSEELFFVQSIEPFFIHCFSLRCVKLCLQERRAIFMYFTPRVYDSWIFNEFYAHDCDKIFHNVLNERKIRYIFTMFDIGLRFISKRVHTK